MEYRVREIRPEDAAEIGRWRYPGFYSTYDFDGETATSAAGFDAVDDADGTFVGYGCFGAEGRVPGQDEDPGVLDVGAGLHPERMHRGRGQHFALALLSAARQRHPEAREFRVAILDTNIPSQRVCLRLGFRPTRELVNRNGRFIEFRRSVHVSRVSSAGGAVCPVCRVDRGEAVASPRTSG